MAKARGNDLFKEQSTMPFGDHLEELRLRLWRALVGLGCGVAIGFFLASHVIQGVSRPIRGALEESGYVLPKEYSETDARLVELEFDREALAAAMGISLPQDNQAEAQAAQPMVTVPVRLPEWMARALKRDSIVGGSVQSGMLIYFKAAIITGFVLASPWIFYQFWCFVAAGLYRHEKYYVHLYMPFSLALFLGGAAFCYFAVFPPALRFLLGFYDLLDMEPLIQMGDWISFALMLPLVFGIGFQLPLVMLLLERIGVFTTADYRGKRKTAILVIAVAAMMLTPPDPYTMIFLMVPMLVLYEVGILLVRFLPRRSPFGSVSGPLGAALFQLGYETMKRRTQRRRAAGDTGAEAASFSFRS